MRKLRSIQAACLASLMAIMVGTATTPAVALADAPTPRFDGTHEAGTKRGLIQTNNPNINRSNLQEPLEWNPEYTLEIGSHVSDIDFNSLNGQYELTDLTPADFGEDGLPGTDDDGSGWKISFKESSPRNIVPNPDVEALTRWNTEDTTPVKITLPSYLAEGTEIPVKSHVNADELPGDVLADNEYEGTITVSGNETVSQDKWTKTPLTPIGEDVSWGVAWSNTTSGPHSGISLYDVLPYEGDANGTKLSTPLSDIRFNLIQTDDDVEVYVSDNEPSTEPTDEEWVKLDRISGEPAEALDGEITMFKIVDPELEAGKTQLIEVTASTEGTTNGDTLKSSLSSGNVESPYLSLPVTSPVVSELYETSIAGRVFYDDDQSGSKNDDETNVIQGSTIELKDSSGNVVSTTTSDGEGHYSFTGNEVGDYVVSLSHAGSNVEASWKGTTPLEKNVKLTPANPTSSNDFGFFAEIAEEKEPPSIEVVKKIKEHNGTDPIQGGTEETFVFTVTNTGDIPLSDIKLTDSVYGQLECSNEIPVLAAGESFDCEITEEVLSTKDNEGNPLRRSLLEPTASTLGYDSTSKNYYTGQKLCTTQDFCPSGQTITDLDFTKDGNLVAAYGDWNSNVDSFGNKRVSINEISPISGRMMRSPVPGGSEAFDKITKIDGNLYMPTTDPSDKAGYNQTGGNISGAWTDEGDDWDLLKTNKNMIHTFDIAKRGDTYYMSGSASGEGGVVLAGKKGEAFKTIVSHTHDSYTRIYGLLISGDNLYYILTSAGTQSGLHKLNLETLESEKISIGVRSNMGSSGLMNFNGQPVVFSPNNREDTIYRNNLVNIETNKVVASFPNNVDNFYQADDGETYALSAGRVYRVVEGATTHPQVAEFYGDTNFRTLAVKDNQAYIGGTFGRIEVIPFTTN